jgi:hypothetical protein
VVGALWAQADARSVVEPETPTFGLFRRNLQPLTSQDPLNTFLVHRPAGSTSQRRDATICVAAVLAGKLHNIGSQRRLVIGLSRESCAASTGADPMHDMLVSRRCQARSSHDPRTPSGARGLEVSLCSLCQDQLVQCQVRDRSPKTTVLSLQLLEPLHLITLQAAILIAPPIMRYFRNAYRSDPSATGRPCAISTSTCRSFANLPKLRYDLLSRMPLPCHRSCPPSENNTSRRTTSKGAD